MSAAIPAARRSGMQKKVLSAYRALLRVIRTKPIENQPKLADAVRHQFRQRMTLDKKDFFRVDYFARRAEKYLRLLQHPSCVDIDVVPEADEVENSSGGAVQPSQRRPRRPVVTIPPPAEL